MSKILAILAAVAGYLKRNFSELVNLVEGLIRFAGSIASLTPTPKDDSIIASIKAGFKKVKDFLARLGI